MTVRDICAQMLTIGKAVEAGATRKSAASFELDAAGNCQSPVGFSSTGRPSGTFGVITGEFVQNRQIVVNGVNTAIPLFLDGYGRCRKCPACLKVRARQWSARAVQEVKAARRTWFITFTLRPERSFHHLEVARQRCWRAAYDLDALNPDERFREWCRQLGSELTLSMKRVRKNSGAQIRYMFVFERHASGDPHIHGLIHESYGHDGVTKRVIQNAWHEGFSNVKLLNAEDTKAIFYVTKYLSKSISARIRASLRYGEGTVTRVERLLDPTTSSHRAKSKDRSSLKNDLQNSKIIVTDQERCA